MATQKGVIGIDIGGTKTLCVLVNPHFEVVDSVKFKTKAHENEKRFSGLLCAALQRLLKSARHEGLRVSEAGVGCPGMVDTRAARIEKAPNIPFLADFPIEKVIQQVAPIRVWLGNDVQFGLYGEHQLGVAQGYSNVLGVFFGTGVGGALVINHELYSGGSGHAGQIGALLAPIPGDVAEYGTLDDLANKASIAGTALGYAAKKWAPHLLKCAGSDLSKVTWGALARSIRCGDECIERLMRNRLRMVGATLAGLATFLGPDMIVLGGGLVESMPTLVRGEIKDEVCRRMEANPEAVPKVAVAHLKNSAGALGAAKFAWDQARSERARTKQRS